MKREWLRRKRKNKELTSRQLAEKTGLSVQTIGKYEQGKSGSSVGNLFKISATSEVGIKVLLGEDL